MPDVKILHTADLHLEWPFIGMGADRQKGRLRREELKSVFTSIIDLAQREQVDLLLIAGDLFEHRHATRGLMQFIDAQFRRIPGVRVFISPGNHDPYLPGSYYETYPWPDNVYIFRPEVERVDLPDLPVTIYGWGFGAWEVSSFKFQEPFRRQEERVVIGLFHGGDANYHPFRPAELSRLGADYIALGHIHKEGVVLEERGRVLARYPGSPQALSFGEPGEHGVVLGTVSKGQNRLTFVPTGRRQYITREVNVAGAVSLEDLADRICAVANGAERRQHCYRLVLTGAVDPDLVVDLSVLSDKLASDFYFLHLEDETSPDYDLEMLAMERSARGLFVQRMQAMMTEAEADPERQNRVRRALALGLHAFAGKGVGR